VLVGTAHERILGLEMCKSVTWSSSLCFSVNGCLRRTFFPSSLTICSHNSVTLWEGRSIC
jgi:hypothetical protein